MRVIAPDEPSTPVDEWASARVSCVPLMRLKQSQSTDVKAQLPASQTEERGSCTKEQRTARTRYESSLDNASGMLRSAHRQAGDHGSPNRRRSAQIDRSARCRALVDAVAVGHHRAGPKLSSLVRIVLIDAGHASASAVDLSASAVAPAYR